MAHKYSLSAGACIGVALLVLLLPLKWLIAAILAAAFHELCHIAAVKLCGGDVSQIRIGGNGAVLQMQPMHPVKELLCVLAGPLGGLILLFASRWLPRIAICAGVQSIYNLLPLYPLDGGRALHCVLRMRIQPDTTEKICVAVEEVCLFALWALAFFGMLWLRLGIAPILLVLCAHLRYRRIKTPCKLSSFAVQ